MSPEEALQQFPVGSRVVVANTSPGWVVFDVCIGENTVMIIQGATPEGLLAVDFEDADNHTRFHVEAQRRLPGGEYTIRFHTVDLKMCPTQQNTHVVHDE